MKNWKSVDDEHNTDCKDEEESDNFNNLSI